MPSAASHEHQKLALLLLRAQPLLKELPVALGTALGREKGLDPASFDALEYLRANFAPRVSEYICHDATSTSNVPRFRSMYKGSTNESSRSSAGIIKV